MRNRIANSSHGPRSEDTDAPDRWKGAPVVEKTGVIAEIMPLLPEFDTRMLSISGEGLSVLNPSYRVVYRKPTADADLPLPVGVVSRKYRLVQHAKVLEVAVNALNKAGVNTDDLQVQLRITENGERMSLGLLFPDDQRYSVSLKGNGDTMRLRLQCLNSVDGSVRFMAFLGWYRFVCSNGMMVGITKLDIRQRHYIGLDIDRVGAVLSHGLPLLEREKKLYVRWRNAGVEADGARGWIDGPLRKRWGVKLAARTFHIVRTGSDADFALPFERGKPSDKTMIATKSVPGLHGPAANAFDVSQALSWLAKERRNVQEQVELMMEIPEMMEELMKAKVR